MDDKEDEFDDETVVAGQSGVKKKQGKRVKKKKMKKKVKSEQSNVSDKRWPTAGELEWIRTEPVRLSCEIRVQYGSDWKSELDSWLDSQLDHRLDSLWFSRLDSQLDGKLDSQTGNRSVNLDV